LKQRWFEKMKVFGKLPRLYAGQKWPELAMSPPPVLTALGRKLAGFLELLNCFNKHVKTLRRTCWLFRAFKLF
jgi:hypothetical protein